MLVYYKCKVFFCERKNKINYFYLNKLRIRIDKKKNEF